MFANDKGFQHTAARRRLHLTANYRNALLPFQHTAARRRLLVFALWGFPFIEFKHTAARRRLLEDLLPKYRNNVFQHTAARRRLQCQKAESSQRYTGFNTQPRGGGCFPFHYFYLSSNVSTHSRAEAAARPCCRFYRRNATVSTHSRAEAAASWITLLHHLKLFQHTAARRRLHLKNPNNFKRSRSFNTQPRGGGCPPTAIALFRVSVFQHTAARRRLPTYIWWLMDNDLFQHTAARRRLRPKPANLSVIRSCFNTQPRGGGCRYIIQ